MDVKGQHECERFFLILMWLATGVSFVAGVAADNVRVMFGTFSIALVAATAICLPEWSRFNSSPLTFRPSSTAKES
jgi:Microsomal signal peptidase 12 kDa subunit (SPC12)